MLRTRYLALHKNNLTIDDFEVGEELGKKIGGRVVALETEKIAELISEIREYNEIREPSEKKVITKFPKFVILPKLLSPHYSLIKS